MSKSNGKRENPAKVLQRVQKRPHDDSGYNDYPFLCDALYPLFDAEDKLAAEGGTLTIRADGAYYRVTITLPAENASTHFSTDSLVGILTRIEEHMRTTQDWVADYATKKKARNRLKRS